MKKSVVQLGVLPAISPPALQDISRYLMVLPSFMQALYGLAILRAEAQDEMAL
jgi:hypothetical protein